MDLEIVGFSCAGDRAVRGAREYLDQSSKDQAK